MILDLRRFLVLRMVTMTQQLHTVPTRTATRLTDVVKANAGLEISIVGGPQCSSSEAVVMFIRELLTRTSAAASTSISVDDERTGTAGRSLNH